MQFHHKPQGGLEILLWLYNRSSIHPIFHELQ